MSITRKKSLTSLLLLSSLFLVACSQTTSSNQGQENPAASTALASSDSSTSSASQVVTNITLTGANGQITLAETPKKIVVLDNGVADTLKALGQTDRIVAMPTDSLPTYLKDINKDGQMTNVGNLKEVDLETIASLEPDLIIASGRTSGQIAEFEQIAPTIYFAADSDNYWASVQTNILEISKLFGQEAQAAAEEQIADIQAIVDQAAAANKDTTATTLTVLLNEGNLAGISPNGRYSFIYKDLGFQPTSLEIEEQQRGGGNAGGGHGSGLSFESIAEINPSIIFVVDRSLAIGGDTSSNSDVFSNELIQTTAAASNNKIITLTSDLWYLSGGGLESTKLMFQEIAAYAGKN